MPASNLNYRDTATNYKNLQKNSDIQPEIILLDWPKAAQERYRLIKARWEMSRARSGQHENEIEQARKEKNDAAAKLYALEESYRRFGKQAPKEEIEKLKAQVKFFKDKCSVVPNDIQCPQLDNIDAFIRNFNGEPGMADVDFIDAATPEMYSEAAAVTSAFRKALGNVERAPRPKATCETAVIAELDMLAARGAPKLDSLQYPVDVSERTGRFEIARGGDFIEWPLKTFRPGDQDGFQVFDSLAFHVWLCRAEIEKKLLAEIRSRKHEGLSPEDKVAKVRDLHAQIAAAVRREDAILLALESQGGFKWRKKHFHPAVLLGIEISNPSRIAEFVP